MGRSQKSLNDAAVSSSHNLFKVPPEGVFLGSAPVGGGPVLLCSAVGKWGRALGVCSTVKRSEEAKSENTLQNLTALPMCWKSLEKMTCIPKRQSGAR